MQTFLPWFLFAAGVFYTLGGIVLVRHMAMDALLNQALARLTLKSDPAEETATRLLTVGAWLTLACGIALMALSRAALVIFILNIMLQSGYLLWASRARPPEDAVDASARRATRNALLIYIGMFGLLLIMERDAAWRSWLGSGITGLAGELLALSLATAALVWLITHPPRKRTQTEAQDDDTPGVDMDDTPYDPALRPACLRLAPEYNCWPTWDDETYTNVDPAGLGFSDALLERIRNWDILFQDGYSEDDPFNSRFRSLEEERLWTDQADGIWRGILEEWSGAAVNKVSLLPYLMRTALEGIDPHEFPSEERVERMARECRLLEIQELLAGLDALAAERAAVPDWDGDTADDIARTQKIYAMTLARTQSIYREDVTLGLASAQEETRRWVALALDGLAG